MRVSHCPVGVPDTDAYRCSMAAPVVLSKQTGQDDDRCSCQYADADPGVAPHGESRPPLVRVRWSRLFGQFEGGNKVYSG